MVRRCLIKLQMLRRLMLKFFKEEVDEIIAEKKWDELKSALAAWPEQEIAELLPELPPDERIIVFRLLPHDVSTEVFACLDASQQAELVQNFADEENRRVLTSLTPDDRTALFEELPSKFSRRLINLLPAEQRQSALTLLGYPEDSIGRLMTPNYVAVRKDWTVAQALEHIRKYGKDSETLSMIYVIDDNKKLLDEIRLRKILLADPAQKIESLMDNEVYCLRADQHENEAIELFKKYDLYAMPVVDSHGVLVGMVTVDDVLDVAEQKTTEEIQKSAAVVPLYSPYRDSAPTKLYRSRVGWLLVLILVNIVSSSIIASYEEVLESFIALTFFIPLLIGSGGNAGSQAVTLIVRALSTADLKITQFFKAFSKELLVGAMLGASMGVASSLLGFFKADAVVGLIVGVAMFFIILVANLIGTTIPFALTKLKVDPAVASSPLITTIADAVGLMIYFFVATQILALTGRYSLSG